MRLCLALAACLGLSGCIDALVEMEFVDNNTVEAQFEMALGRQLYDMMGRSESEVCPDGEAALDEARFTCRTARRVPLEEVLANGLPGAGPDEMDPSKGINVERLDATHLRVTIDFAQALAGREIPAKPEGLDGMEEMLRAAVAGHSFVFRVRGPRITETTGTLSDDGRAASRIYPVALFLEDEPDLGPPFVTTVQLAQSCWLGLWCD